MRKKDLQILLVALIFGVFVSYILIPSAVTQLGVIDTERTIGDTQVTSGDALTIFALFGTTVSVAIWLSGYMQRRRR